MNSILFTSNRSRALIWVAFVVGAAFVGRLFYLQIVRHDFYEQAALMEHTSKYTLPAQRGLIYTRDGSEGVAPLALNEASYIVYADPRYVSDEAKTAEVLRRVAGGNVVDNFESGLKDKSRQYVVLAKQISQKQADLITKEKLAGVGMKEQDRRVYPEGQLAAQALGYVDSDGKGQYGIEQFLNSDLAGKPGQLKALTDVSGIPLSVGGSGASVQQPAQNGKSIILTIDRGVQNYVEQALKTGLDNVKAKHGSAIVMDPGSGAVVAMANYPSFDPAQYYKTTDYEAFQNAVVSSPYEAGSVVKTFTMAAGINEGVVAPNSTYENTGKVTVGDTVIKNVLQTVNGKRTMTEVFEYSLNTGVVHVLTQLGGGSLNQQAREKLFGYFSDHFFFGKLTGIEQSGELAGQIIAPDQDQGNNVRYANMSFGQGMDTTMIQLISAYSAMVNGGVYYKPHLVYGYIGQDGAQSQVAPQIVKSDVLKSEVSSELREMMHVARSKSMPGKDRAGYYVGGKTGTAQVIDAKTGKYTDSNAVGSYLGFGGNETPRYVIMIRVMDAQVGEGFSGSLAAAPIFADISNWLLDYLKVQPMQ
jgi:cell division protein FtsI/penicillin-binding protein 2